jgi:hypothetical protein
MFTQFHIEKTIHHVDGMKVLETETNITSKASEAIHTLSLAMGINYPSLSVRFFFRQHACSFFYGMKFTHSIQKG